MADAAELTKSAKRRAAKKARDAVAETAAQEAAPAPPPAAEPKAKAKGKAKAEGKAAPAPATPAPVAPAAKGKAKAKAEPAAAAPKAKGKAKADPKAEAKAAAAAPAPKSAAAKGKAKVQPAPEEPVAVAKPAAKPAAKGKAKAAKTAPEEPAPAPRVHADAPGYQIQIDDGTGPAWEVADSMSKKTKKKTGGKDEKAADTNGASHATYPKKEDEQPQGGWYSGGKGQSKGNVAVNQSRLEAIKADIAKIMEKKVEVEAKEPEAPTSTAQVVVPEKRVGIAIGPQGKTIKLLQERTQTKIDTMGEVFTITGPPPGVQDAEKAIKEIAEKGYCQLMFDSFAENFVNVHPKNFPDIIGKQGSVIRRLKDELNVDVSIPEVPKDGPAANRKHKVSIAGEAQGVEAAKQAIMDIVMYGHSELTHPGQGHDDMDVEQSDYKYIIGAGGGELKHIQNNWKVKVHIPKEHSENKKVLIVGDKVSVGLAKAYMETLIEKGQERSKGRDQGEKGYDHFDGDDTVDEESKAYIIKR